MSKQIEQDDAAAQTAVMDPIQEAIPGRVSAKKVAAPIAAVAETPRPVSPVRKRRAAAVAAPVRHFSANHFDDDSSNRQAELFYLQKQIQQQTPMVFILEDGERIQGVVEWYDRHSIKVRGKSRVLIYKTAIKYLYKAGEIGSAPEK
jgi:sRNA-binding regulator protein Hfq